MTTFDAPTLVGLRRVSSVAVSPDHTWLAVAVQRLDADSQSKYVSDLWRVPLDGGEAIQLTRGKWNDHSPGFMSDGALAFLSNRPTGAADDEGHDKRNQLFVFPLAGGEPLCLTEEPLGVSAFKAARTTDLFCVAAPLLPDVPYDEQRKAAKERAENGPTALVYEDMPVRFWDHWLPPQVPHLVRYAGGDRKDLTPDATTDMHLAPWTLAPDGSFVVVHPTRPESDRIPIEPVLIVDTTTAEARELASQPRTSFGSPVVSHDGTRIAMTRATREDGMLGRPQVVIAELATGALTVLPIDVDTSLAPCAWTEDDTHLLMAGPLRTHRPVFVVDAATGAAERITSESAGGNHIDIDVAGGLVVGIRSTVIQPPEAFACPLEPGSQPRLLTNLSGFQGADFAVVEDHEVTSTDGVGVQYMVVRPREISSPTRCLMAIHGGPIADWADAWHWRWNPLAMAAAGYVVALPNPRGSVGFGQEFIEGIWNNQWGGQCYEDLMTVADELAARPDVDPDKMVAIGGSFGGYMTNWIGSQTDRFACLITHASIFDMTAFHGVTDLPAWWAFSFGAHPYAERREYDRYSPIAHIDNWKSPTLIIHGDRDYRVPIGESLSLFEALRFHDVDAKLLVFPDENHWILRPRNIEEWYGQVLDFANAHTS